MENITYNTTLVIDFKSKLLANVRLSLQVDGLILFLICPMGVLGTLFNSISLFIFCFKVDKKIALFKYLQVYSFCCLIMSFSQVFFFYFCSYRLFDIASSYVARLFKCYISSPYVTSFFFFYSNVIDAAMNIERAFNYSTRFQNYKNISVYKTCFVLLIICLVINIPNNMAQQMVSDEELYIKLRYCISTEFALSSIGKNLLMASFIIQGPLVLILILLTNILSVVSFKLFLRQKTLVSLKKNHILSVTNANGLKRQEKNEKKEKSLLKMTFFISSFSLITLLIQFISQLILYVYVYLLDNFKAGWFVFLFAFAMVLKQFLNIFLHFHINQRFRSALIKLLCCNANKKNLKNKNINFHTVDKYD